VIADDDDTAIAAVIVAEQATQREVVSADHSAYGDLSGVVVRSDRA
jgi:hypothetical protein